MAASQEEPQSESESVSKSSNKENKSSNVPAKKKPGVAPTTIFKKKVKTAISTLKF
jgi:hypothetical protein